MKKIGVFKLTEHRKIPELKEETEFWEEFIDKNVLDPKCSEGPFVWSEVRKSGKHVCSIHIGNGYTGEDGCDVELRFTMRELLDYFLDENFSHENLDKFKMAKILRELAGEIENMAIYKKNAYPMGDSERE